MRVATSPMRCYEWPNGTSNVSGNKWHIIIAVTSDVMPLSYQNLFKITKPFNCIVILIAGIFPQASSNGAHDSQSDDSTSPCAVVFTSPLTSRLCSQLQELQELPTSPLRMWSSSKSISFYLPGLLDRELNPGPGGTKLMLYHWAIHTSLLYWMRVILKKCRSWIHSKIFNNRQVTAYKKWLGNFNLDQM